MKYALFLTMILVIAPVSALHLTTDTQVVLGTGDRQTLADDFSAQLVDTADVDSSKEVLIIGGPCANPLWEQRTGMACGEWPYGPGEGMVVYLKGATLIAGTTPQDTERLVSEVLGTTFAADRQTVADTSNTGNQFTVTEGESRTIRSDDGRVLITGLAVNNGMVERVTINGERYTSLARGRSITTDDEQLVRILEVGQNSITVTVEDFSDGNDDDDRDTEEVTLNEGDTETITISGERIEIEDLNIDDDTIDVTVDGERFTNLEEGDTKELNDVEFEVEDIGEDDATFSFEETRNGNSDELDEGDTFTIGDGDDETVEVDGDEYEFRNAAITNTTMSVSVDGTSYSSLSEGSSIDTGDVTFQIEEIDEDEAEISVDDIE